MKKKWFRTMELVDEKYIEEAAPIRTKRIVTILVASAACLALTLTSLWLFLPYDNSPPSIENHEGNEYYAVIEKLNALNKVETEYNNKYELIVEQVGDLFLGGVKGDAINGAIPQAGKPVDDAERGDGNYEYTTGTYEEITDNQVEGITEADRIKRSSTHIYYLDGNTLRVFDIAGLESKEVGSVSLGETYLTYMREWEFYLSADCKTATVLTQYKNEANQLCVGVVCVDVSDPAEPTIKNKLEIAGNYLSSRVTDGKILLMTEFVMNKKDMDFDKEETFLPQINGESIPADCIILPEEVNTTRYTVVMKLDEDSLAVEGQSALLSYSEDVYVSQDHIFLTHVYADTQKDGEYSIRNSMTEITALSYKESFEKKGTAVVRGYVKDQWSMDEYEGILRVVTTTNATKTLEKYSQGGYVSLEVLVTATGNSNASLYCIDLKDFKVIASVEDFAPPREEVQSVRFDKDTAYVCTSIEMSDPVFFFDLSDLNNITYKDTGTIEGFSTSLVNFGDGYLLGIGQENWNTFKAEIYTETEKGVEGFCKYVLENADYSTDYKSYYIDRENQLVGLGIIDYSHGDYNNSRYLLLHFDGYELRELLNISFAGDNDLKRGVYIDGFMYLFGQNNFKVVDVQI
ncbi:MAG: beta-propeller domain-containing protein [Oscillospiraceae bacterium]|nr:beta-propeller domain-containing protein [Oscillospiraceae bacterium]